MPGPVVVVGAGVAGVRVVRRLRMGGYDGPLTLLDAQHELPYDRPPLSKAVLTGERDLPVLLDADALAALAVDWRPGTTAAELLRDRRLLVLADGSTLAFGTLVIATGARARTLPGLGADVLRTWSDAARLRDRVRPGATVVVVGAGVVGCEVAASLRSLGAAVHLVDALPAPMVRVLGRFLAGEVHALHRQHGVELHLDQVVESCGEGQVRLSGGRTLTADVVLQAVGAEPEVGWLASSGLHTTAGVHCDLSQATGLPDVWVVGDAAAPGGRRSEHWTAATQQADRLVATLLGRPVAAPEPPYWWSDQYDVKMQGLGEVGGHDEVVLGSAPPGRIGLLGRAGRVVGAVGFNAPRPLMALRAAVQRGDSLVVASAGLVDAEWHGVTAEPDGVAWSRRWREAVLSTVGGERA